MGIARDAAGALDVAAGSELTRVLPHNLAALVL
jgi:hypothetical protein